MKPPSQHPMRAAVAVSALVLMMVTSAGCLWAPELTRVERDFQAQIPEANFQKRLVVSLGPVSLAFARLITRMVPDAREAADYLRDVSHIQLAIYETKDDLHIAHVRTPARLERLRDEGWEAAVQVRDDDDRVWVFYRTKGDHVAELYVVVLDQNQLVMVKARGKLEHLAALALREAHGVPGVPHAQAN